MANEQHLQIVSWGYRGIQEWRAGFGDQEVLDLSAAELPGVDFHGVNLKRADFRRANLRGARIFNCDAAHADFEGADLTGAMLGLSKFPSANFKNANLHGASLMSAELTVADLTGANLSNTWLQRTYFERNPMAGASFAGANIQMTFFIDLDLSEVVGLDQIANYGFSYVGVETLYKSKGRIPDSFLRRCGVSRTLITYLHALVANPIEFFSCFISYTEADDALSRRLYNDLQGEGVRCWRWREDAKWGSTLLKEVDQSIRVYDKLVVILSEQSLQSEPVIREIERALQKEARERKEVLFPIRVDSAIFDWKHELQADVVRKVIGDFSQWQDAVAYAVSLRRLVAGLQAPSPLDALLPGR